MDTPTIAKYYREKDPMERLKLLEQSIAAGEEPEENRIRKELWEIRYSDNAVIWFWSTWISVRQINPITQRFSA